MRSVPHRMDRTGEQAEGLITAFPVIYDSPGCVNAL